jgi:hypothetical protein
MLIAHFYYYQLIFTVIFKSQYILRGLIEVSQTLQAAVSLVNLPLHLLGESFSGKAACLAGLSSTHGSLT